MFEFNMPVAVIPEAYREFLPTMTTPAVNGLLAEYADGVVAMREFHKHLMSEGTRDTLEMFADGLKVYTESTNSRFHWAKEMTELFHLQRAIDARTEVFWLKLFDMCSLSTVLPASIWREWHDRFTSWRKDKNCELPPFVHEHVYRCLSVIESHRANFFSLRVEGVWKSLSNWHKTNFGSGFGERFIIDYMFNDWAGTTSKDRDFVDLVNIATTVMTGTDNPFFNAQGELRNARSEQTGEWVEILDGGLRIKAFKRGTLHCEVHPEIARRLNVALAYLHPNALPDDATMKRPRKKSGFGSADLLAVRIPRQVRGYLGETVQAQRADGLYELRQHSFSGTKMSYALKDMIDRILAEVGGIREGACHLFDYPPEEVISEIIRKGEVPEKVSHQFFATPAETAREFVAWVGLEDTDICYESSAGTGSIARQMPVQTYCIEVDQLRCIALDKMGFEVKRGDFLKMMPGNAFGVADAVLMNPPYCSKQYIDHVEHALEFVRDGGVVAAILPEGAVKRMPTVKGLDVQFSEPMPNRFPDAAISVVFARITKSSAAGAGAGAGAVKGGCVDGQQAA